MSTWESMSGSNITTVLAPRARMNMCLISQICESAQRVFRNRLNGDLFHDVKEIYRELSKDVFDENTSS